MQIEHELISSENPAITNSVVNVKKAIVSILFTVVQNTDGEEFFK